MSSISSGSTADHLACFSEAGGVTSDFTFMFRYRVPAFPSSGSILAICTNGAVTNYFFVALGTTGLINVQDSAAHSSTAGQLVVNTNYHIAVVHVQGSTTTLYVNGVQIGQITGITYTMDESALGGVNLAPDVAWQADDIKTWTSALSGGQVASEIGSMSPVAGSSWEWFNLDTSVANFGFLDGEINGSSRQLKYQGDFTLNASQLPISTGYNPVPQMIQYRRRMRQGALSH